MNIFKLIYIKYMLVNIIKTQDVTITELTVNKCKEKNKLISTNKSDSYDVVGAILNETIILECHYCNELDDNEPKIWYKIDETNHSAYEVALDMYKDEKLNRISVSPEHSLTIHHSILEDIGTYYCRGLQNNDSTKYFNYIIDLLSNTTKIPEKGNITYWKSYFQDYIYPINKRFLHSNEYEFKKLRHDLKTQLEVIIDWELEYKPCEICGRPIGEGIQEKYGYCRIKIENNNSDQIYVTKFKKAKKMKYFLNLPKISCTSILLEELFPDISNITKQLNDFVLIKKCNGICNPGANQGYKFGSSKGFKYRRTVTLKEGEHLTLICPDATLENTIIWRRNGKVLTHGEPIINDDKDLDKIHIVVDTFNSLYLIHVTEEEAGNYTCQVDDIRMQQIRVFVYSKSKLLTDEFVRHMKYLGFILLLSSTCYCAGVIITCKQKHKFKGYQKVSQNPV